jgi:hypothetical protein
MRGYDRFIAGINNLALWGAIFAIGYALAGKVHPSLPLSICFVVLTGLLSGVWALFLQKTKRFDKSLFGEYRARIERLLEAKPLPLNSGKPPILEKQAWFLFYVVATLLFSFGVVIILQAIPLKEKNDAKDASSSVEYILK